MLMTRAYLVALVLLGWLSNGDAWADVVPKVLIENLSRPLGVAIQPETGDVFVAEVGSGRVVRIDDGQLQPVIVELPHEQQAGAFQPMGLEFIDRKTLVLTVGRTPETDAAMYVAQVPDVGDGAVSFDSLLRLGPIAKAENATESSDLLGITASKSAIYAAEGAGAKKGWILQTNIRNLKDMTKAESFGRVTRFIATSDAVKVGSPAGITLSSRGEIVVGQMGALDGSRDSQLSFYRSTDGRLLLNLETGLFDIVDVCYGAPKPPSNKAHLYVLDLAMNSPEFGGLFRLDAEFRGGKQGVRAVKMALLDRPAAMALGSDGSLYVTVLGPPDEAGKVLQFEPGL